MPWIDIYVSDDDEHHVPAIRKAIVNNLNQLGCSGSVGLRTACSRSQFREDAAHNLRERNLGSSTMKLSKAWLCPGYLGAFGAALHFGGWACFCLVALAVIWVDFVSFSSASKDVR